MFNEQLMLFKLVQQLVMENGFNILHFDRPNAEVWVEKQEKRTNTLLRLSTHQFGWENQFNMDVLEADQKVRLLEKKARRKFEFHNIYIASHAPIENVENNITDSKGKIIKFYSITATNWQNAINILNEKIDGKIEHHVFEHEFTETEIAAEIEKTVYALSEYVKVQQKRAESILMYGKPMFTYILIAINVFIFILLEINGGSNNPYTLIEFGAKYNPAILEGEWWRLFSSMFLHVGILHLLMNMLALYYLGTLVERIYGKWRFLLIYLLGGLGGSLASFVFTVNIAAGASGAIFGLFGALLFFGIMYRDLFFRTMGSNIFIVIGINIVFGFTIPQIDNAAHIGGLIAGFIATTIVFVPNKNNKVVQILALAAYLILVSSLWMYGNQNDANSEIDHLNQIEQLINEEKYDEAIEETTKKIDGESSDYQAELLFQRSFAYIRLLDFDRAIEDLEASIEINDQFPVSHYNLALLYAEIGEFEAAEAAITRALELEPDKEEYLELHENIKLELNQ